MKRSFWIFALLFVFLFQGCDNNEINKKETSQSTGTKNSALTIGQKYYFFDGPGLLECPECDPCWFIQFKDKQNALLWSSPCSGSSSLKSCSSDVSCRYEESTNTLTILSINNNNVSSECKTRFIGDWQWSEGKFGKRFYSKNNPGCDFHN